MKARVSYKVSLMLVAGFGLNFGCVGASAGQQSLGNTKSEISRDFVTPGVLKKRAQVASYWQNYMIDSVLSPAIKSSVKPQKICALFSSPGGTGDDGQYVMLEFPSETQVYFVPYGYQYNKLKLGSSLKVQESKGVQLCTKLERHHFLSDQFWKQVKIQENTRVFDAKSYEFFQIVKQTSPMGGRDQYFEVYRGRTKIGADKVAEFIAEFRSFSVMFYKKKYGK